ncbi:MAG: hypothetical protein K8T26_08265 [Lentisphaerae bacterium]|nr:hypothetical protein [Lentisphaerota bacterium]
MKPTPTERLALAAARAVKPLPLEEFHRLANHPALDTFGWRHIRHKLALTRLAWAAEEWNRREIRNHLYRDALAKRYKPGLIGSAARSEISYLRVTQLETSTKRIREKLVYAFKRAQEAQAAAWSLL